MLKFNKFSNLTGEKLSDEEVEIVFKECMDPEDEDGYILYARKCLVYLYLVNLYTILCHNC